MPQSASGDEEPTRLDPEPEPEEVERAEEAEVLTHEAEQQEEGPPTWHDVALSIGAELMNKLRSTVKDTLGYTMSAVSLAISR